MKTLKFVWAVINRYGLFGTVDESVSDIIPEALLADMRQRNIQILERMGCVSANMTTSDFEPYAPLGQYDNIELSKCIQDTAEHIKDRPVRVPAQEIAQKLQQIGISEPPRRTND